MDPSELPLARKESVRSRSPELSGVVVTLTLNPALDLFSSVETIEPWRKLRCDGPDMSPGGGGVNVAQGVVALGGRARAVVALGGHVGRLLADSIDPRIRVRRVEVAHPTRQNFCMTERATGQQFRFIHRGARMTPEEWARCLQATVSEAADASCVVISSSMPFGLPTQAIPTLIARLRAFDIPVIVDTSGPCLLQAIQADATLVKPSVNELCGIVGHELCGIDNYEAAARDLLDNGRCQTIAISLGADGALFVPRDDTSFTVAVPPVHVAGTSGAGDAMVAGIAHCFARQESLANAARYGVACGTAAVLKAGSELLHLDDVERLLDLSKLEIFSPAAANTLHRDDH